MDRHPPALTHGGVLPAKPEGDGDDVARLPD
jgi:hypothetical protein